MRTEVQTARARSVAHAMRTEDEHASCRYNSQAYNAAHLLLPAACAARAGPGAMPGSAAVRTGDELAREWLAWRGFASALHAFDEERAADPGASLSADRLASLIFESYVPNHDAAALTQLLDFLQQRFFARLDAGWAVDVRKLESSVLRLFVVCALQAGRRDKVLEVRAQRRRAARSAVVALAHGHGGLASRCALLRQVLSNHARSWAQLFEREAERLLDYADDWQARGVRDAELLASGPTLLPSPEHFTPSCYSLRGVPPSSRLPKLWRMHRTARRCFGAPSARYCACHAAQPTMTRRLACPHAPALVHAAVRAPPRRRRALHGLLFARLGGGPRNELSQFSRFRVCGIACARAWARRRRARARARAGGYRGRAARTVRTPAGAWLWRFLAVLVSGTALTPSHQEALDAAQGRTPASPDAAAAADAEEAERLRAARAAEGALIGGLLRAGSATADAPPPPPPPPSPLLPPLRTRSDGAASIANATSPTCTDGGGSSGRRSGSARSALAPPLHTSYADVFSGHAAPLTCARFSPDGGCVASASADGTVRIWEPRRAGGGAAAGNNGAAAASRNATLYCGAAIAALEWEPRTAKLLLLVTSSGGVRAWNAEAKRLVCDAPPETVLQAASGTLAPSPALARVRALRASPTDASFAVAAGGGVTLWALRSFSPMHSLPLPPGSGGAAAALAYNHNGRLLAAGCADGTVRLFDVNSRAQIMAWRANASSAASPPITSLQFGPDQTSVFSLGADGILVEWSLHAERSMRRIDASAFCVGADPAAAAASPQRHEMALQPAGRWALLTSRGGGACAIDLRAPGEEPSGACVRSLLGHSGAVTSVDWHPAAPAVCLTGGEDATVRTAALENDGEAQPLSEAPPVNNDADPAAGGVVDDDGDTFADASDTHAAASEGGGGDDDDDSAEDDDDEEEALTEAAVS